MSESTPKLVKTSNQDAAMDPDVEPILTLHRLHPKIFHAAPASLQLSFAAL